MGCNCYDSKKNNSRNNNPKNSIIVNRSLDNSKKEDKFSVITSFNQDKSINNFINNIYINTQTNKNKVNNFPKNNIDSIDSSIKNTFPLSPHTFTDLKNQDNKNEKIPSNRECLCNISKFNFNDKKREKNYIYKFNKMSQIKKIVEQIKRESDYKETNKNVFLFYKGSRVREEDTIYDILNKNNNNVDNIINNNVNNKKKDSNEIDFDMISFSMDIE